MTLQEPREQTIRTKLWGRGTKNCTRTSFNEARNKKATSKMIDPGTHPEKYNIQKHSNNKKIEVSIHERSSENEGWNGEVKV